jgi:peptide/nickel transport system permease protein
MSIGFYILRRFIIFIPMLIIISIISFVIIQLPPGDFLTMYIMQLQSRGYQLAQEEVARLAERYGLNDPLYVQYFKWIKNIILYGDLGRSFQYDKPVSVLIKERIGLTMLISICTVFLTWIIAIPIGIYSATHQYSIFDYLFTFLGFIGVSLPGFLIALIFIYIGIAYLGINITGLFSPQFADASWSLGKFIDMLKHIWVPIVVIGINGTAGMIRTMRGCLLDELSKPYVVTARAKGLPERKLLIKYPVRVAINPILSTIGWLLPGIVSGETLAAIVLNIPTTGPLLLTALRSQDMYLAGSFILILSALTLLGSLISDILLAWIDPRIRYE